MEAGRTVNPVYDITGSFLGNTKEGFTGEPIIASKWNLDLCKEMNGASSLEELSASQLLDGFGTTFDKAEKSGILSETAQEKIYTDIVSKCEGMEIDGHTFNSDEYQVKFYPYQNKVASNIATDPKNKILYLNHQYDLYETTVENIQCAILNHEWFGHDICNWDGGNTKKSQGGTHYKCYEQVVNSSMFSRTTQRYQNMQKKMLETLSQ